MRVWSLFLCYDKTSHFVVHYCENNGFKCYFKTDCPSNLAVADIPDISFTPCKNIAFKAPKTGPDILIDI